MFFSSDNWAGAHPAIAAGLARHASGFSAPYGSGDLDKRVTGMFSEIFERDVAVFFVATGTAANALSLVSVNRPGGLVFCHRESHVMEDECGAPEHLMGGSRLFGVEGPLGRMDLATLERDLDRFVPQSVHQGRPIAISVTQATEQGTVYDLDALDGVAALARDRGLAFHMDGARFANALVTLGCSPADMTWRRGVDLLSFGGTKNGCWCAEAIVAFDPAKAADLPFIRKRAAQTISKSRFVAAQFEAYLTDGLWLDMARHANAMAARLADHMRGGNRIRLGWEPQANEVFAIMPRDAMAALQVAGASFYDWPSPRGYEGVGTGEVLCRFVTSFATTAEEVDAFGARIAA